MEWPLHSSQKSHNLGNLMNEQNLEDFYNSIQAEISALKISTKKLEDLSESVLRVLSLIKESRNCEELHNE